MHELKLHYMNIIWILMDAHQNHSMQICLSTPVVWRLFNMKYGVQRFYLIASILRPDEHCEKCHRISHDAAKNPSHFVVNSINMPMEKYIWKKSVFFILLFCWWRWWLWCGCFLKTSWLPSLALLLRDLAEMPTSNSISNMYANACSPIHITSSSPCFGKAVLRVLMCVCGCLCVCVCVWVWMYVCRFLPSTYSPSSFFVKSTCVQGHADQMGSTLRNVCAEFIFILFYSFWLILFSRSNWELTVDFDAFIRKKNVPTQTKRYAPNAVLFRKSWIFRLHLSKIILQLVNSSKSIWYRIIFLFPLFQKEMSLEK